MPESKESNIEYVIGTVAKEDPVLRFTASGKAVTNFSIRVPGQKANEKYGRDAREAYFLEVSVWDNMAETVAESCRKGDRVLIQGIRGTRSWERKDGSGTETREVLTAWEVGLSLRYVTAEVTGVSKTTPKTEVAGSDESLRPF